MRREPAQQEADRCSGRRRHLCRPGHRAIAGDADSGYRRRAPGSGSRRGCAHRRLSPSGTDTRGASQCVERDDGHQAADHDDDEEAATARSLAAAMQRRPPTRDPPREPAHHRRRDRVVAPTTPAVSSGSPITRPTRAAGTSRLRGRAAPARCSPRHRSATTRRSAVGDGDARMNPTAAPSTAPTSPIIPAYEAARKRRIRVQRRRRSVSRSPAARQTGARKDAVSVPREPGRRRLLRAAAAPRSSSCPGNHALRRRWHWDRCR